MFFFDAILEGILYLYVGRKHSSEKLCLYLRHPTYETVVVDRSSLPTKENDHTRLCIVSDTHDQHVGLGRLPKSDVFIHCGDIFMLGQFKGSSKGEEQRQEVYTLEQSPRQVSILSP